MSDVKNKNWPDVSPNWDATLCNKLFDIRCRDIPTVKLQELIEKSDRFPIPFPVSSIRCKILKNRTDEEILEKNINSAYPVIHEQVLHLYANFILHKRQFGTAVEKELYKEMTIEMLVDRLLTKRAAVFVGPLDINILLVDQIDRCGNWELIGTPDEKRPYVLRDCISYDEVKLSALLAVSTHSQFINIGNRRNRGIREEDQNKVEQSGVVVGLVGPRFQKPNFMDFADIIVTKEQNCQKNGYGKTKNPSTKSLFINFFGEPCLTYKELKTDFKDERKFTKLVDKTYFNNVIYERRLSLTFDTFLIEANERAKILDKMAYVHVVGFGLGVWRISNNQFEIFMNTFSKRVEFLGNTLDNISDICFSYIEPCGKYRNGDTIKIPGHPSNGIKIHIFNRDPHSKLEGPDKDKLLVASYAWDGNSLPGNEFWAGSLESSSDPAAACSTQVAELQNAHINPRLCGANLRIATLSGLVTLTEYWTRITNACMGSPWPAESFEWTSENYNLLMSSKYIQEIPNVTVQQIIENSKKFPIQFPIESVKCETVRSNTPDDVLKDNINSVYPIVHEKTLSLYTQFLVYKRKFGASIERQLYKDMTLGMLVDRLLTKRAAVFIGYHDKYMLLDGFGRVGKWETIGKLDEKEPLVLNNCLSYDEIKLSALLSVSSYTQFINIGDRNNCGRIEPNKSKIEDRGIIVGVIGARFEKANVMEYQDVIVSKTQNVQENGYGTFLVPTMRGIFLNFYEEASLAFEEIKDQFENKVKFTEIRKDVYFNNLVYEKRLALSVDTLLLEANERAKTADTMAYLHVVGFGLGVWKISQHQEKIFMDVFAKRIEFLSSTLLNIADICFSHISHKSCGKYTDGNVIPIEGHLSNGIRIHIFNREPHEKLSQSSKGNLLIVSYAWDGNALPGNEFWLGQLAASGDPAAASSTQIAELHNPHINPVLCAANLRIATLTGVLTLTEYQDRLNRTQESDTKN